MVLALIAFSPCCKQQYRCRAGICLMFSCFCLFSHQLTISHPFKGSSFPSPTLDRCRHAFFCLKFVFSADGGGAFTAANLETSSVLHFAPCFNDNLSMGFFFFLVGGLIEIIWSALPIWMSHRHSGKLQDFTLQLPPAGSYHYTLKQGWTVSHEGNHTKNGTQWQLCGNPLLLPAVVVLLTNDCRQIEFHPWRTGGRV